MTRGRMILLMVTILVTLSMVASADFVSSWDPQFTKWLQNPEMGVEAHSFASNGFDLASGLRSRVADDFACITPGPVDRIQWWGSYLSMTANPVPNDIDPNTPGYAALHP